MSQPFRTEKGGRIDRAGQISFTFDGEQMQGHEGDTLASALLANGVHLVGRSFKYHRPRGIVTAGSEEPNALVGIYRHKELRDHNMASLIVGTGGNKEGLGAHQEEVRILSKDHIDEPTKKAVCFVEKGFTKMFVYDNRLVANFFSVEANRVKDILVM